MGTGDAGSMATCAARRRQAAHEVEGQKARSSHAVFHVLAKYPEKQAIPQDVHPATVQEHGQDRRQVVDRLAIHQAEKPAAERHGLADGSATGELAWHQAQVAHAGRQHSRAEARPLDKDPYQAHHHQQADGHQRKAQGPVVVADGDHGEWIRAIRYKPRSG